jgi:hypothetical protein
MDCRQVHVMVNGDIKQTFVLDSSTTGHTRLVLEEDDVVTIQVDNEDPEITIHPTSRFSVERVRQFK